MLHGTNDRIVPYELGQRLFEAAPPFSASHIPKRFVTLEGADHNGLLLTHEREFTAAIEQFLAELSKPNDTP
jgi:pimeloyl-ACP methyl ester carboxylesterase